MVPTLKRFKLTYFATGSPRADQMKEGLVLGFWAGQPAPPVLPWRGLRSGQAVVVHMQGLPDGAQGTVLVSECSATALTGDARACRTTGIVAAKVDAGGNAQASYVVKTGTVGDGGCGEHHPCYVEVWQPSDPAVQSFAQIAFAPPH
jgi:hypothetical protein